MGWIPPIIRNVNEVPLCMDMESVLLCCVKRSNSIGCDY